MDSLEEIKKLKALLDQGAITTEEFNKLKKKKIGDQAQLISGESKPTNKFPLKIKRRSSLLTKMLTITVFALFTAMVILGVKYIDPIKEKIANVLQNSSHKNNKQKQDENTIYDGKKKIGKIVKIEIESIVPFSGGGVTPFRVPEGRMWTPLYYEKKVLQ